MDKKTTSRLVISVVMATYNGDEFIAEAIQSVLDQTFTDFEFIIVDDGSTDATASIIASFDDPRIIYIKKETNTGIAASLNLGIAKAKGQYIARMDDDDVCEHNRFEEQLKVFKNHKNLIVCGTTVLSKGGKVRVYPEYHDDIKMTMLFNNPITHPTVMMRKDAILKFPYDPKMVPSEDYDLWSRLIDEVEFYILQTPHLFYRQHVLSETSQRRREQLQLNVSIVNRLFTQEGFHQLDHHDMYLRIFTSKDYTISGHKLKGLQQWFGQLKQYNAEMGKFPNEKFNDIADTHLEQFIIRYFMNKKYLGKVVPFFYLNYNNKKLIMNHYVKKLI